MMTLSTAFPLSRLAVAATLCLALVVQTAVAQPAAGITEQHKWLKKGVGTWDATVKVWYAPNAAPITSQGQETGELLPGGLWLISRFEGNIAGMPYAGAGIWGYDPVEEKYVGTTVDSMTPHIMTTKGDYDPDTKTMTTTAEGRDPATGKTTHFKMTTQYPDDDTRLFEMNIVDADGKLWKMMEIKYTRAAE